MKIAENKVSDVGNYCRSFRIDTLNKTLSDISGDTNIKTLSGFEHGRSTNLLHVFTYLNACTNQQQRSDFLRGLCNHLEGVIL